LYIMNKLNLIAVWFVTVGLCLDFFFFFLITKRNYVCTCIKLYCINACGMRTDKPLKKKNIEN
jgi:hypothetical protein